MSLKLEEVFPESELQQNLGQLNIADNKCGVAENLQEHEAQGESANNDEVQDRKPMLDNKTVDEKKCSDEPTRHTEDGSHEINVTNDNDKDKDVASDESDFSLPKHRKECPSDDERTDSEPSSNEEDEMGSEDNNYRIIPTRKYTPPSEIYITPYEQVTPIKPSNTHLQVNGADIPFEISPMSLGDSSLQDDDIDIARIVNPIVRCIDDLKSEFYSQLAKFHYYPDPNLDEVKDDENWQHVEFDKPQDQYCYDAITTAGKLLDVIIPMQLPEEAKEHLTQARHILLKNASLYRDTENINDVDHADNIAKSGANANENNKSSERNGLSVQAEGSDDIDKTEDQTLAAVDDTTTINSGKNHNVATPHKYRRGSTQGRKLRRHSARGAPAYSSPKGGRRSQNYSPRSPNVRSPHIGSTSVAGSTTQTNNRRFVGFLPSRCFTCGGIGHFATNCPNKGTYITASTSNQQSRMRRRGFRRTTEPIVNNSTSNK